MALREKTEAIREKARALGFQACGFARAEPADPQDRLRQWLERGYGGEMHYLKETMKERQDPAVLLPGARSVIALAISYDHPDGVPKPPLKIARYAQGDDYHRVLRKRVRRLRRFVLTLFPEAKVHPTIDTSPVMEKVWAERAGIAWIGKSTLGVSEQLGTYTFFATLITTAELTYDAPHVDRCGSCTACLDACPTQAFPEPYVLDATRCITYWTLEHRAPFTEQTPPLHGWIAGCDVCQEVCPYNKWKVPTDEPRFRPRPELVAPDLDLFTNPERLSELRDQLAGTALLYSDPTSLQRNARRVHEEHQAHRTRPPSSERPGGR